MKGPLAYWPDGRFWHSLWQLNLGNGGEKVNTVIRKLPARHFVCCIVSNCLSMLCNICQIYWMEHLSQIISIFRKDKIILSFYAAYQKNGSDHWFHVYHWNNRVKTFGIDIMGNKFINIVICLTFTERRKIANESYFKTVKPFTTQLKITIIS